METERSERLSTYKKRRGANHMWKSNADKHLETREAIQQQLATLAERQMTIGNHQILAMRGLILVLEKILEELQEAEA